MRFEELVKKAMTNDVEVCKAVHRLYRGDLGINISANMYGERYLLFMRNVSGFEDLIRSECNSFYDDGERVPAFQLSVFPEFTFVLTGNPTDGYCNYALRVTDEDLLDYYYLPAEYTFGKTLVSKKGLERVLRKRGWM